VSVPQIAAVPVARVCERLSRSLFFFFSHDKFNRRGQQKDRHGANCALQSVSSVSAALDAAHLTSFYSGAIAAYPDLVPELDLAPGTVFHGADMLSLRDSHS
jgi:hypothetical protein